MSYKESPYPAKTNSIEEVETNAFVFEIYLTAASSPAADFTRFRRPLTQNDHDVLKFFVYHKSILISSGIKCTFKSPPSPPVIFFSPWLINYQIYLKHLLWNKKKLKKPEQKVCLLNFEYGWHAYVGLNSKSS